MKFEGSVEQLVPRCTCELIQRHRGADMVVFSVPSRAVRFSFAALPTLPVLGATFLVVARTGLLPTAVSDGPLNPWIHGGLLLLILGLCVALVISVANMRLHSGRDYVFGVLKTLSIVFGVVSFLRMLGGVLP